MSISNACYLLTLWKQDMWLRYVTLQTVEFAHSFNCFVIFSGLGLSFVQLLFMLTSFPPLLYWSFIEINHFRYQSRTIRSEFEVSVELWKLTQHGPCHSEIVLNTNSESEYFLLIASCFLSCLVLLCMEKFLFFEVSHCLCSLIFLLFLTLCKQRVLRIYYAHYFLFFCI